MDISDIKIEPDKKGAGQYMKISCPMRYGRFGEIRTPGYIFGFNLNGEIKTIQGRTGGWLESAEWLKRTAGNDWACFSAGGYNGAFNYTGEYYVPCFAYQTNAIFGRDRFEGNNVQNAFNYWHALVEKLSKMDTSALAGHAAEFIGRIRQMPPKRLEKRGKQLHDIIGGRVTVLPPETRHVEYDVIPAAIADGCLYNCGFCRVKSGQGFSVRSRKNIEKQLFLLKSFYDRDLVNYNSVFLGSHDALFAGCDTIEFAAQSAFDILKLNNSAVKNPRLFLFGSADSILRADTSVFAMLNSLPFYTHINIGLESADPSTLSFLQKPLSPKKIRDAFSRMLEINRGYANIEISANFVIGDDLPETHLPSIVELTRNSLDHFYPKGDIYLSPLENTGSRQRLMASFNEFKKVCRLPAYLYLIQRL